MAALELASGDRVLDLATGTADLAILVAQTAPDVDVIGVDPSRNMLAVGQRKIEQNSWRPALPCKKAMRRRCRLLRTLFHGSAWRLGFATFLIGRSHCGNGARHPQRRDGLRFWNWLSRAKDC